MTGNDKNNLARVKDMMDFKKEESIIVLQHEYAITNANSSKPILATVGAGPCFILALYDTKYKTAFLAHIDNMSDMDQV